MSAVKFTQLKEKFDSRKLNFIVYNSQHENVRSVLGEFVAEKQTQKGDNTKDYSTSIKLAKKYLKFSRHGEHLTTYKQTNGKGRWFACGSLGLQEMSKPIRQTIAGEFYDDVDISNCHPTILLFLCKQNNVKCTKLEEYVNNRQALINIEGCNPATIKQVYLSLLNGGKKDYKNLSETIDVPSHMIEFKEECARIHTKFSEIKIHEFEAYTPIYEEKKAKDKAYNVKASFVNKLMEEVENKILMCMWKFFGKPEDCVYCFDGIMLKKGGNYDLEACANAVEKEIGIKIKLEIKPMNPNYIVVPDDAPEYNYKPLRWFKDYVNITTTEKKVVSELAVKEWVDNTFAWIENDGTGHYIALNEGIDVITKSTDRKYKILEEKDIYKSLKICCNIANPKFDKKYYEKWVNNTKPAGTTARKDVRFHRVLFSRLSDYIIDRHEMNEMKRYSRAEFVPYLKSKHGGKAPDFGREVFNLFQGFSLEDYPPSPDIDFTKSKVYDFIREIMCNNNEPEFKHLLYTIADMLQNPAKVSGISHLFYSMQGAGKSSFGEFMSSLLGEDLVITIIRHDRYLYNSFNSSSSLKLLKIFEELPEKKSLDSGHSILKGEITQKDEIVEFKGKEAFKVKNYASIWSFTNFENALYIENSDRRNVLHKCSNKHADDKDYFVPIRMELQNKRFMKAAFDYFATLEYDPIHVMTAFDTEYKQEQKLACLPKGIKFIKTYVEELFIKDRLHAEDYDEKVHESTKYRVSLKKVAEAFKNEGGNKSTLETQLKRMDLSHSRLRVPDEKNPVEAYVLYPPDIEKRFRLFLKNKTFKFDYGTLEEAKEAEEAEAKEAEDNQKNINESTFGDLNDLDDDGGN